MKVIFITFSFVVALFLPFSTNAAITGLSFGGTATAVYPCNSGLLVYLKSARPPYGILPVMWLWGELPFLSHIPPHPGQQLLGIMAPTPIPCILGYFPVGAGFPIEFHGSSL